MKKNLLVVGLLCLAGLVCSSCYAEIAKNRFEIATSEEEFDLAYFVAEEFKILKKKNFGDVYVNQAFKFQRDKIKGELRYSLFKDSGGDEGTLDFYYRLCAYTYLYNIAGYDVALSDAQAYPDDSVKEEFNADFGKTIFISKPTSKFAKGYSFMNVDFFYKEGQGLVFRTFLFNDPEFVGVDITTKTVSMNSMYHDYFHSFLFMDKDENGDYIPLQLTEPQTE